MVFIRMKPILLLVAVYSLILNQSNKKPETKKFPPVNQVQARPDQKIAGHSGQGQSVASGFRYGIVSYVGFYGASLARPMR
jgi:hypothetical protein